MDDILKNIILGKKKIVVSDRFNRADAATLGNADTGQAWSDVLGTIGITSNKACAKIHSSGNAVTVLNAGIADLSVSADIAFATTDGYAMLLARSDGTTANTLRARISPTEICIVRTIASSSTTLVTYPYIWVSGEINNLKLVCKGNDLKIYLNKTLVCATVNDNALKALTNVGILLYKSSALPGSTLDNFKIEAI